MYTDFTDFTYIFLKCFKWVLLFSTSARKCTPSESVDDLLTCWTGIRSVSQINVTSWGFRTWEKLVFSFWPSLAAPLPNTTALLSFVFLVLRQYKTVDLLNESFVFFCWPRGSSEVYRAASHQIRTDSDQIQHRCAAGTSRPDHRGQILCRRCDVMHIHILTLKESLFSMIPNCAADQNLIS